MCLSIEANLVHKPAFSFADATKQAGSGVLESPVTSHVSLKPAAHCASLTSSHGSPRASRLNHLSGFLRGSRRLGVSQGTFPFPYRRAFHFRHPARVIGTGWKQLAIG